MGDFRIVVQGMGNHQGKRFGEACRELVAAALEGDGVSLTEASLTHWPSNPETARIENLRKPAPAN